MCSFLPDFSRNCATVREAIPVRGKDEVWDAIYARMDDGTAVSDAAQPETGRRSPAVMSSVPSRYRSAAARISTAGWFVGFGALPSGGATPLARITARLGGLLRRQCWLPP